MFGTYHDGPALAGRWQAHADSLALVMPFGGEPDEIIATIDAVASPGKASADPR